MRKAERLSRVLARQWMAFAAGLCLLLAGAALLLLFVLEDRFIDNRLHEQAAKLETVAPDAGLPAEFVLYGADRLPDDLVREASALRVGRITEFRRDDGHYVHVLRGSRSDGTAYWLVYDVSDQLFVNAGLRQLAPYVVFGLLVVLGLAMLLARSFVGRTVQRAGQLLARLQQDDDPAALRRYAASLPVVELRVLAERLAAAWQARQSALQEERETLAFLAHELRTPLQSLKTDLALLPDDAAYRAARQRVARSSERLQRAMQSVLWLSSEADASVQHCEPGETAASLVAQLQPLATQRGQQFVLDDAGVGRWSGPAEALEAVLGNLMLNAVQHGGAGQILLRLNATTIEVRNPLADGAGEAGFGIGLAFAGRLCRRCGWRLDGGPEGNVMVHRLTRYARGNG